MELLIKRISQNCWRFWLIVFLSIVLSLRLSQSATGQIIPSQLVEQAQIAYQQGEFSTSVKLLEQAERIYRQQGQTLQQAQILNLSALGQQELGNWQQARQNLTDCWALLESVGDSQDKTQVMAQFWQTQGNLDFALGKYQQALNSWQQAEQSYEQNQDPIGVGGSLLAQSQALEQMGFYRRSCDRLLTALDHPDEDCRELSPSQIDTVVDEINNNNQSWKIEAIYGLAHSLLLMGQLELARHTIISSQKQIQWAASPLIKAKILMSLGNIHKAFAIQAKAVADLASFTQHLAIARKTYQQLLEAAIESPIARQYRLPAQLNLLSLLVFAEKWSAAQKLVTQVQLATKQPRKRNLYAEFKFARDLERLKQNQVEIPYSWQDIAQIYLEGIQTAQTINFPRMQSYGMGYLGALQQRHPELQLTTTPQNLIETALNLAQQIDASEIAYRWQWHLGQIYRQQGHREAAIASYRASLATLQKIRSDLAPLTREIQFDFEEQIRPIYLEFTDLLLESTTPEPQDLAKAIDVIEALQIAELDNFFQDACLTFTPKTIDRVDPQAAAIYAISLPDRLEVIMARSNSQQPGQILSHHAVTISQTELIQQVSQLRRYITEPDRTIQVKQLSAQLYDWLLRPFAEELAQATPQNLVFIVDSILQPIPMSILYDGEQYLLETYAIATTPGLRMLNPQQPPETTSYLAGGISKSLEVENRRFPALSNIERELSIFAPSQTQVLINSEFTSTNLLQQINATAVSQLHIATHGQFSSNPAQTFLLMWQKLLSIKEFGNLLYQRQSAVSTPMDLIVLSACDTALGDRRAALGLAGIAVRSGALSTMATLWQVNDESTAVLMKHFYHYLPHHSKAEALRLAQLELQNTPGQDWSVPAFWASYILIGNWQ